MKKHKGFTLAETLITLTILGVVAAITVPSLINKYSESANRTKVKKAMAVYEKALNQMIIENDLKSNQAIIDFGEYDGESHNTPCANTRPYFKPIENGGTNCQFKTADRVWWDITDIEHPVISLKDQITTAQESAAIKGKADSLEKDKTSFVMVGTIDNGVVRINDKGGVSAADKGYLDKLYVLINPEKEASGVGTQLPEFLAACEKGSDDEYTCNGTPFVRRKINERQCVSYGNNQESCADPGDYWVPATPITYDVYGTDAKNCEGSTFSLCKFLGDYYNAANRYCESIGDGVHLATLGELVSLEYTDGNFWASEDYDSINAYAIGSGNVGYGTKGTKKAIVCVGN